ncbi:zinc finger protein basonuclin-2, partial [Biomphalaria glabrata]
PSQRHPSQSVPSERVTENLNVSQTSTMKPLEAIRCTQAGCPCECFAPGKQSLRYCDSCNHGWVAHGYINSGPDMAHVELKLALRVTLNCTTCCTPCDDRKVPPNMQAPSPPPAITASELPQTTPYIE